MLWRDLRTYGDERIKGTPSSWRFPARHPEPVTLNMLLILLEGILSKEINALLLRAFFCTYDGEPNWIKCTNSFLRP